MKEIQIILSFPIYFSFSLFRPIDRHFVLELQNKLNWLSRSKWRAFLFFFVFLLQGRGSYHIISNFIDCWFLVPIRFYAIVPVFFFFTMPKQNNLIKTIYDFHFQKILFHVQFMCGAKYYCNLSKYIEKTAFKEKKSCLPILKIYQSHLKC